VFSEVLTPTYFKVLSVIDEDAQEHQGVLVERIHDSLITTPRWMTPPGVNSIYFIVGFWLVKHFGCAF
jgi:hypothetical protein